MLKGLPRSVLGLIALLMGFSGSLGAWVAAHEVRAPPERVWRQQLKVMLGKKVGELQLAGVMTPEIGGGPLLVVFVGPKCKACDYALSDLRGIPGVWSTVIVHMDGDREGLAGGHPEGEVRQIRDTDGTLAVAFGVAGLPTALLIDSHRVLRTATLGPTAVTRAIAGGAIEDRGWPWE